MARLPDGWVFIPRMKDAITIELKQMELVTCRHCKHYRYYGLSYDTISECKIGHCENPDEYWFCADGEEEDAEM